MSWKACFCSALVRVFLVSAGAALACAQREPSAQQPDMQEVLKRLDLLEQQNQQLLGEIKALRQVVQQQASAAGQAAVESDAGETAQRVRELQQTKVEASQRFPVTLTGMLLFDASDIHGTRAPEFQSAFGDYGEGPPGGGASFNQSIVGLRFDGPERFGAKVNGFLSLDLYTNGSDSYGLRLRRAGISFDWKRRSLTFGQDKTLLSPYEPTSYAHVGVPALAGAGNLWLWQPQVRYDERIPLSENWMAVASGAVFETNENYGNNLGNGAPGLAARPAAQGRLEVRRTEDGVTRFALGIGGHASTIHVGGQSVPSRLASVDWNWAPWRFLAVTGSAFQGHAITNLGALSPGFYAEGVRERPVEAAGGWLQFAFPVTSRLTFDLYGGRQINHASELTAFQIVRTFDMAGNALYRFAPNVVLGLEAGRDQAQYLNGANILGKRFDVTVAYLF